jgi:hypothetical protein
MIHMPRNHAQPRLRPPRSDCKRDPLVGRVAELGSAGIMRTSITDSYRALFYVPFCLFETLFIASVIVLACTDPRRSLFVSDAVGLIFWFAFTGLFIASFILRRAGRRLAVIGWLTLFGGFWGLAFTPVL